MKKGYPFSCRPSRVPWRGPAVVLALCLPILTSCGNLSPTSKPQQNAGTPIASQPVVTGDANAILTEVTNKIKQTQNEVWPWVVALGVVVLGGCAVLVATLAAGFWLIRRWMTSTDRAIQQHGYIEGKKEWAKMAQACVPPGAKT